MPNSQVIHGISESERMASHANVGAIIRKRPGALARSLLTFAASCITIGIMWDISWHETIGRDTFWTPAHMAIYLGGALEAYRPLAGDPIYFSRQPDGKGRFGLGLRCPRPARSLAGHLECRGDDHFRPLRQLVAQRLWFGCQNHQSAARVAGLGNVWNYFWRLLLVLTRQNRLRDGAGSGLFVFVGGIFLVIAGVFVMEYSFPNMQHAAIFYQVCAVTFPFRLVALGRAGRTSWPVTRAAAVYILIECLMIWILPLFPAQPRLAPIFNPVTHMAPPPFLPAGEAREKRGQCQDAPNGTRKGTQGLTKLKQREYFIVLSV